MIAPNPALAQQQTSQSAQKLGELRPMLLAQTIGFAFLAGVLPRAQAAGARNWLVEEADFDRLAE